MWLTNSLSLFQADSQAPEPHLPGMPSPRKIHGSFLHKAVSPSTKKSPARPTEKINRSPVAVRKNLVIGELQKEVRQPNQTHHHLLEIFYFRNFFEILDIMKGKCFNEQT